MEELAVNDTLPLPMDVPSWLTALEMPFSSSLVALGFPNGERKPVWRLPAEPQDSRPAFPLAVSPELGLARLFPSAAPPPRRPLGKPSARCFRLQVTVGCPAEAASAGARPGRGALVLTLSRRPKHGRQGGCGGRARAKLCGEWRWTRAGPETYSLSIWGSGAGGDRSGGGGGWGDDGKRRRLSTAQHGDVGQVRRSQWRGRLLVLLRKWSVLFASGNRAWGEQPAPPPLRAPLKPSRCSQAALE